MSTESSQARSLPRSGPHPVTAVGVDVGERILVAAVPVDAELEDALVVDGDHVRKRHEVLVEATRALQGAKFDSTPGEAQLFAALWHQIRPQVFDAAVRTVRYAQRFPSPVLVLEDLAYGETPAWTERTSSKAGCWLLPALQDALVEKAVDAGVPVTTVDPAYTSQECHRCGELGSYPDRRTLRCENDDCPVDDVCRDRSAAASIATRIS